MEEKNESQTHADKLAPDKSKTQTWHLESQKTYMEQTKLLVTLSSSFIIAPPILVLVIKDDVIQLNTSQKWLFLVSESFFVLSVLSAYLVFSSISGGQAIGCLLYTSPSPRDRG